MIRVAILTNELPPYRRPIFEALGAHRNLAITVYLSTRKEPHRLWDPVREVPNVQVKTVCSLALPFHQNRRERFIHFPIGALPALVAAQPEVVISGEFGFRTLMSWLYAALFRRTLIIWSEETPIGATTATRLQRALTAFLSRRAAGFLAFGLAARTYLRNLGVEEKKISVVAQSIDNDYWIEATRTADTTRVYQRHDITGHVVLCVGNLLYPKGIHHLIRAWSVLPTSLQRNNTLLLVGDGREKQGLQALARSLNAQNVIFTGPIPYSELPAYYSAADFFVFPTLLDVWGLVVNEAMAAGLPVLCSKYAGCAEELILPGKTGAIINPDDTVSFSQALAQWLRHPPLAPDPAIQAHIRRWSYEASAEAFLEQLAKVGALPLLLSDLPTRSPE